MRRRYTAVAAALAGVLALAGVAHGVNVYSISQGSTGPGGKGSATKPLPKRASFAYSVTDDTRQRGKPVIRYKIALEGLVGKYARFLPKCRYAEANSFSHAAKCRRARVGRGKIENLAGPTSDQNNNTFCNLAIRVYNLGDGLALRLDADPPPPATQDGPVGCALPVHQAIRAKFRTIRLDRITTSSLEFDVPRNLAHPINGLDNVVAFTRAAVDRKTTVVRIRGKRRRVGIYSAIGCRGSRRTLQVAFTDETPATTRISRYTTRC